MTDRELGERRHERCRFGVFASEAVHIDERGRETPFAMPVCAWALPLDAPPAARRAWGGAIDFERDCAACAAFREL